MSLRGTTRAWHWGASAAISRLSATPRSVMRRRSPVASNPWAPASAAGGAAIAVGPRASPRSRPRDRAADEDLVLGRARQEDIVEMAGLSGRHERCAGDAR